MSIYSYLVLIVPADQVAAVDAALRPINSTPLPDDARVVTGALSADGAEPATHYWAGWAAESPAQAAIIRQVMDSPGCVLLDNETPATGLAAVMGMGLQPVRVEEEDYAE